MSNYSTDILKQELITQENIIYSVNTSDVGRSEAYQKSCDLKTAIHILEQNEKVNDVNWESLRGKGLDKKLTKW